MYFYGSVEQIRRDEMSPMDNVPMNTGPVDNVPMNNGLVDNGPMLKD